MFRNSDRKIQALALVALAALALVGWQVTAYAESRWSPMASLSCVNTVASKYVCTGTVSGGEVWDYQWKEDNGSWFAGGQSLGVYCPPTQSVSFRAFVYDEVVGGYVWTNTATRFCGLQP